MLAALRNNVNQNDRALYNLLVVRRILRWLLDASGTDIDGKVLLEIGTSKLPGLPLACLLDGCLHYHANNIFAVDDFVHPDYAGVLELVMAGTGIAPVERFKAILSDEWHDGVPVRALRPEHFSNHSPVPAQNLDLPDGSVDICFSVSVLEHVDRPREVIATLHRMLRPGGLCVHTIDLRDHRDFHRPLAFLAEADYPQACGTENRLRASDFIALFQDAGFETAFVRYMDTAPQLTGSGHTDLAALFRRPLEDIWPRPCLEAVQPWVTEAEREALLPEFGQRSLAELSVTGMALACRKALKA